MQRGRRSIRVRCALLVEEDGEEEELRSDGRNREGVAWAELERVG